MQSMNIQNLNFKINHQMLFHHLSLKTDYGSIVGIIGPNGIGKSMLFKIISGLIIPQSGSIIINGKSLKNGQFANDLGALIEEPGFIPRLSGFDNLDMLASIKNIINKDKINQALKKVGLWKDRKKKVKNYSLGMKKKLGIAQSIMENPKVIILDEPMNALDEESVNNIRKILLKLANVNHSTILIASHNMHDINLLCDKVYKINHFKLNPVSL
ncbi:ABC transporter ATP-binding protein [Philodulcilactobacillus myokoensis]|uniref:ABC transporter ATP-binding protein n=1 Tax=Philodulcilactobacillus myokoensis TaxID=2929573 RepID=A0A9W6ESH4_9LACO|nr:ABC transporter ATP-binding protein [Philodulcilactobacillus myokoensis]GLB46343.1 ABC transporter ATP-binding protein [Philodulcilactobacillus myokoensis]